MSKLAFIISVILLSTILGSCSNGSTSTQTQEKSIQEKIQDTSSIEETRTLLNGTTWHYTEDLHSSDIGFWVKVVFDNNQVKTYYAEPSDGDWSFGGIGSYTIEEGRFSNNGEKYIAIKWNAKGYRGLPCNYVLITNNLQFGVQSSLPSLTTHTLSAPDFGFMEFGDFSWN